MCVAGLKEIGHARGDQDQEKVVPRAILRDTTMAMALGRIEEQYNLVRVCVGPHDFDQASQQYLQDICGHPSRLRPLNIHIVGAELQDCSMLRHC